MIIWLNFNIYITYQTLFIHYLLLVDMNCQLQIAAIKELYLIKSYIIPKPSVSMTEQLTRFNQLGKFDVNKTTKYH